jgi:hypothetical protein
MAHDGYEQLFARFSTILESQHIAIHVSIVSKAALAV